MTHQQRPDYGLTALEGAADYDDHTGIRTQPQQKRRSTGGQGLSQLHFKSTSSLSSAARKRPGQPHLFQNQPATAGRHLSSKVQGRLINLQTSGSRLKSLLDAEMHQVVVAITAGLGNDTQSRSGKLEAQPNLESEEARTLDELVRPDIHTEAVVQYKSEVLRSSQLPLISSVLLRKCTDTIDASPLFKQNNLVQSRVLQDAVQFLRMTGELETIQRLHDSP